jgi:hypothetical protein
MAVADAVTSPAAVLPADGIFPLPLTTFETLMFVDTRPGYPMLVDCELWFQGRIERPAFEQALAFAAARNPLFACLIARAPRQGWHWVPSDQSPRVDWAASETPIAGDYGALVDLTRDIGLKLWVRSGEACSTVLLQFHHACSDGMGVYGFIEDLLAGYANALPGAEPVEPRPLEPERLKRRGLLHVTGRSLPRVLFDSVWGAIEGLRFLGGAPLVLPRQRAEAAGSAQVPGDDRVPGHSATCDRHTVERLRLALRLKPP